MVAVRRSRRAGLVVAARFRDVEADLLLTVAEQAGLPLAEFVRQAALAAALDLQVNLPPAATRTGVAR
jgi:hypothetical protein